MTLEEFEVTEPVLARELRAYVGEGRHMTVEGVYRRDDGRWEAHLLVPPGEFDVVVEARCRPNCVRASTERPYTWVYEDHACCASCEADPAHRYQTVHE